MAIEQQQIERYLNDYANVTNKRVEKFVCPITLRECELSELINGHILNRRYFTADRRTIIQYGKVDNFYGAHAEPRAVEFLNRISMSAPDALRSLRKLKAIFENGTTARAIVPKAKDILRIGSRGAIIDYPIEGQIVKICIMVPPDDPRLTHRYELEADEGDHRYSWTATLVKAAYLCTFHMYGYRAVFYAGGKIVRTSLSNYFDEGHSPDSVERHFREYADAFGMIGHSADRERFVEDYEPTQFDTLRDRVFLVHTSDRRIFAMTCVFRINKWTTSISIPLG